MILFPNSKINIGLNIIGKRPDGYHNLETIFFPIPLKDALEIIPAVDGIFEFHSTGLAIPGKTQNNLCVKAFRLLQSEYKLPEVKMHLHKVIPMGAGLGGGSSDGAFSLKILNDLFNLALDNDQLKLFASALGSDCPFFIENCPLYAYERGDQFQPVHINLSGLTLLLVIPSLHVSTAEAYSAVIPAKSEKSLMELVHLPVEQWKDLLINDFEIPVFSKYPVIGKIKQKLYESGAIYASISGSGSAVYGLFGEIPDIKEISRENFTAFFLL
ncbi:MAG: 4-(cytidine 5'-diphospho)-2-C-methyl-D-erythritol kinase [Bacteroidota bacterium]